MYLEKRAYDQDINWQLNRAIAKILIESAPTVNCHIQIDCSSICPVVDTLGDFDLVKIRRHLLQEERNVDGSIS